MPPVHSKVETELARGTDISIIALVDSLIEKAEELRASDIHIDPLEDEILVRFRIDGVLHDINNLPLKHHSEIISRIKILSGLRTDEHQAAQDGRFRSIIPHKGPVDVRVSIAPTYYGENAVMRILANKSQEYTLDNLGFNDRNKELIKHAVHKPYGMILATGPTGSGKTTTLYTIIRELNSKDISIITIEDPIEYSIRGIEQVQINTRTGLTFASGLRSFLRQDPDIIMVGEIRDAETADLAVNTALTGHLLLSTLHTNDAATTLPRLLDMGVEAYLVASTVNIAIGQRLVRRICSDCKVAKKISEAEELSLLPALPHVFFSATSESDSQKRTLKKRSLGGATFYHGRGCEKCNGSGYRGRLGIHEVIELDNKIRDAILRKASAAEIKDIAMANGMITMIEDGYQKAVQGLTTIDEVIRVVRE